MLTQAYQHGLMQLLPYAGLIPLAQSPPAGHAAAIAQRLRKVFPWNACVQHKQDAVEGGFIADGAVAKTTFARCNERGNEGLQLLPQLFADGGTGHEAAKHKCICSLHIAVVLAALSANLINRVFHAAAPNEKRLIDITDCQIPDGLVYLSPVIDCVDGLEVSWPIRTHLNANLVNIMLDAAIDAIQGSESRSAINSDRGTHYRWPGRLSRVHNAKLVCSMSCKG